MTSKALTWIAIMATILALAAPNILAIEKKSGTPAGVPPGTVADYLRAVIMAHRHFYTIHIANRLRQERIVDVTGPNVRYHLISQWPINKANAPTTEFERRGLKEVQARPNRPYSSTVEGSAEQVFEAVYADVAVTAACVECHNAHPSSPKKDFKVGDVMGGLVISFPLTPKAKE